MVLSGIRPSFPSLSRSAGQITHVLLTRSPLEHPHQGGGLSVRLACVKHAASVRPEPGSNSPKKQTNKKLQAKNKDTNKTTTNNKHQQPLITIDAHVRVHVQTNKVCFIKWHTIEFSNNTTTHNTHPKQARAANSDHTNIQTPPQNHKPPPHNNKISLLLITQRT